MVSQRPCNSLLGFADDSLGCSRAEDTAEATPRDNETAQSKARLSATSEHVAWKPPAHHHEASGVTDTHVHTAHTSWRRLAFACAVHR